MSDLAKMQCKPCEGEGSPLTRADFEPLLAKLDQWEVINDHHIKKSFTFANFAQALDMVNRIGVIAEAQNHHPDLGLAWGKVEVTLWTHNVDGLTENDFIFAAKVDIVYRGMTAQMKRS